MVNRKWFDPNRPHWSRPLHYVAYGCFESIGVVSAVGLFLIVLPASSDEALLRLIASAFLAWATFAVAGFVGVVLSAFLWRELPLPVLGLLTLGVPVAVQSESEFAGWYLLPYIAITLVVPLWWFLWRRKKSVARP